MLACAKMRVCLGLCRYVSTCVCHCAAVGFGADSFNKHQH